MSGIPETKCGECGAPMEFRGSIGNTNNFIMTCAKCGCQETCFMENAGRNREFLERKQ